jgi:hypothetical protein
MSVYYAIPSARPAEEANPVLKSWRERGYRVVIQRDVEKDRRSMFEVDDAIYRPYAGYAEAVNHLCQYIIADDPQAEWIVTGGDDILPDPNHSAEEIARECCAHFADAKNRGSGYSALQWDAWATFGVMQPTGDRWEVNGPGTGAGIDRVAGSPWIGREFARRMYGGRGPLCEEYWHCGEDEELMQVAMMMGVFWQRPDLIHHHAHWGRPKPGQRMAINPTVPAFLERANSPAEWAKFKAIFAERRANNWPGHEPCL